MQPIVSVIIPAYNAEKTLKRCLDSVFAQDFDPYEVILINDGSTDGTLEIAREYEEYSNFVLIDQPNRGVSRARWEGLYSSKGEFIAFVDSDDYIAKNMLSSMFLRARADNADIVVCNWFRVWVKKICPHNYYGNSFEMLSSEDSIDRIVFSFDNTGLWNKLWRKRLLIDAGLEETFNLRYGEDLLFCMNVFMRARRYSFVSDHLYFNVINSASVTHNLSKEIISDYLLVLEKLKMNFLKTSDSHFMSKGYTYYFSKLLNRYQQLCLIEEQDPQLNYLKQSVLAKCQCIPLKFLVRSGPGSIGHTKILLVKSGLFPFFYSIWVSHIFEPIRKLSMKTRQIPF